MNAYYTMTNYGELDIHKEFHTFGLMVNIRNGNFSFYINLSWYTCEQDRLTYQLSLSHEFISHLVSQTSDLGPNLLNR